MIGRVGAMLKADATATASQLIDRATISGRSIGTLAAALDEFFTSADWLSPPTVSSSPRPCAGPLV
jgi:hypothetical protein